MNGNNDNMTYIVGSNKCYEFGLNHNISIANLTNWNETYKTIEIEQVNLAQSTIIYTDKNGNYWVSGRNQYGECGINDNYRDYIEQCKQIQFFAKNNIKINKICTNIGSFQIFWISSKNQLYGNGYNYHHQLGIDDGINRYEPALIDSVHNVIDVQSAYYYSLVLCGTHLRDTMIINIIDNFSKSNNITLPIDIIQLIVIFTKISYSVYSTVYSNYGGNGHIVNNIHDTMQWKEIQSLNDKDIIKIKCGRYHSLFLSANGNIWCCGRNNYGQLGLGYTTTNKTIQPIEIEYFKENNIKIKDIECGTYHNLAIDIDGNVYSWGLNKHYQCSNCGDHNINVETPYLIKSLQKYNIINIKCGARISYVMTDNHKHFIFGQNKSDIGHNVMEKPFCINQVIKEKTNGRIIKNIYFGYHYQIVVITTSQKCH